MYIGVRTAALLTRAIDRPSSARQRPMHSVRTCTLCQLGHHAPPYNEDASCNYAHGHVPHVTTHFRKQGRIHFIVSALLICLWTFVPFWFGWIQAWLEVVTRTTPFLTLTSSSWSYQNLELANAWETGPFAHRCYTSTGAGCTQTTGRSGHWWFRSGPSVTRDASISIANRSALTAYLLQLNQSIHWHACKEGFCCYWCCRKGILPTETEKGIRIKCWYTDRIHVTWIGKMWWTPSIDSAQNTSFSQAATARPRSLFYSFCSVLWCHRSYWRLVVCTW